MVRVKRRYLVIELVPTEVGAGEKRLLSLPINERDLIHALRQAVVAIHGDLGLGSILRSLHVKKFSPVTRVAVVCCQRGPHSLLSSVLVFVREVKGFSCSLRMLYLSGTIRGCLKFLRIYYQSQMKTFGTQLAVVRKEQKEMEETLVKEKPIEDDNMA